MGPYTLQSFTPEVFCFLWVQEKPSGDTQPPQLVIGIGALEERMKRAVPHHDPSGARNNHCLPDRSLFFPEDQHVTPLIHVWRLVQLPIGEIASDLLQGLLQAFSNRLLASVEERQLLPVELQPPKESAEPEDRADEPVPLVVGIIG